MLINNNDRNEDNWGVVKYKKEKIYILAPIFDCGNCFYGKASEERIASILEDENKLFSSAINGITAYEDDDEKRISALSILEYIKVNNKETFSRVYNNVINHLGEIENLINGIPFSYMNTQIISSIRKEYYLKTLMIRLNYILKEYIK